jgi:hypothetical protein
MSEDSMKWRLFEAIASASKGVTSSRTFRVLWQHNIKLAHHIHDEVIAEIPDGLTDEDMLVIIAELKLTQLERD